VFWPWILAFVAACDLVETDGMTYSISITSDVPFKHLRVVSADVGAAATIVTPQLLASGERVTGSLLSMQVLDMIELDDEDTEYSFERTCPDDCAFGDYDHVLADARDVAPDGREFMSPIGFASDADVNLALDSRNLVEETWGAARCRRIVIAEWTYFVVPHDDRDCDGIPDAHDCKPLTFCPRIPSTPAEVDACRCPCDARIDGTFVGARP
jgi:hypothetical protein